MIFTTSSFHCNVRRKNYQLIYLCLLYHGFPIYESLHILNFIFENEWDITSNLDFFKVSEAEKYHFKKSLSGDESAKKFYCYIILHRNRTNKILKIAWHFKKSRHTLNK